MKFPISASAALFSAKSFVAAVLALYIALRFGMQNPYWAVITTYVVAQPLSGAVLSKSLFRVTGTIAGACMSVFLLPPLVQAPELLSLAVALWLGICVFLSLIDRTARAYMFVLAGYSTCIIVFPSVSHPVDIFATAVLRVQEITLGIICSALVHAAIFPKSSNALLLRRLDAILRDASRWSSDALSTGKSPVLDAERRRLAVDINELHELLIHASFEGPHHAFSRRAIQALLDQLLLLFPLLGAVDDRWTELTHSGESLEPAIVMLIDDVRTWLSAPSGLLSDARATANELRERCARLEPVLQSGIGWSVALRLSLLARLSRLLEIHLRCIEIRAMMVDGSCDQQRRLQSEPLLRPSRRKIHRDYAGASGAALAASLTIALACFLWIASGWVDGASAVMLAGVFFSLYSGFANPGLLLKNKFVGVVCRLMLGAIYVLAVLPQIDGFPLLVLALSPVLLISGALLTVPRFSPMAFNLIIGVFSPSIIAERFIPDFAAYLNGGLATLTGVYFAMVMTKLTQFMWIDGVTLRTLKAGWSDIARQKYGAHPAQASAWRSVMTHRVALLVPRMARSEEEGDAPAFDALRDLRTGLSMAELNQLRTKLSPEENAQILTIINEVGEHYRLLARHGQSVLPRALISRIDSAMTMFAGKASTELRRGGTLALVSLLRNLFPAEHYASKGAGNVPS